MKDGSEEEWILRTHCDDRGGGQASDFREECILKMHCDVEGKKGIGLSVVTKRRMDLWNAL